MEFQLQLSKGSAANRPLQFSKAAAGVNGLRMVFCWVRSSLLCLLMKVPIDFSGNWATPRGSENFTPRVS